MAQPPSEACRETLCERGSACLSLSLACPAAVLYSPLTSLKKPNQFRSPTQKGQKGCTCELYLFDKRNKYFWTRMWCLLILFISFHWFIVSAPKTECCPSLALCLYFTPQTQKLNNKTWSVTNLTKAVNLLEIWSWSLSRAVQHWREWKRWSIPNREVIFRCGYTTRGVIGCLVTD